MIKTLKIYKGNPIWTIKVENLKGKIVHKWFGTWNIRDKKEKKK